MNPANYREALIETREDEAEGADILLVGIVCFENLDTYLIGNRIHLLYLL